MLEYSYKIEKQGKRKWNIADYYKFYFRKKPPDTLVAINYVDSIVVQPLNMRFRH